MHAEKLDVCIGSTNGLNQAMIDNPSNYLRCIDAAAYRAMGSFTICKDKVNFPHLRHFVK